jgi:hypothetical protein
MQPEQDKVHRSHSFCTAKGAKMPPPTNTGIELEIPGILK